MAKLNYFLILILLSFAAYAGDESGNWENRSNQSVYSDVDKQAYEDKLKQRMAYNCRQEVKNSYLNLMASQKQKQELSVKVSLHSILVSEFLEQKDKIEQDITFYQWKYQTTITQCQSESLITVEQIRDLLLEIQNTPTN